MENVKQVQEFTHELLSVNLEVYTKNVAKVLDDYYNEFIGKFYTKEDLDFRDVYVTSIDNSILVNLIVNTAGIVRDFQFKMVVREDLTVYLEELNIYRMKTVPNGDNYIQLYKEIATFTDSRFAEFKGENVFELVSNKDIYLNNQFAKDFIVSKSKLHNKVELHQLVADSSQVFSRLQKTAYRVYFHYYIKSLSRKVKLKREDVNLYHIVGNPDIKLQFQVDGEYVEVISIRNKYNKTVINDLDRIEVVRQFIEYTKSRGNNVVLDFDTEHDIICILNDIKTENTNEHFFIVNDYIKEENGTYYISSDYVDISYNQKGIKLRLKASLFDSHDYEKVYPIDSPHAKKRVQVDLLNDLNKLNLFGIPLK